MATQGHEVLPQALCILRRKQVEARVGLSRSTIYARMAEGQFPRNISLGKRAVGWIAAEVDDYLAKLVKQSRKGA
jgi:prophage regulatory protein